MKVLDSLKQGKGDSYLAVMGVKPIPICYRSYKAQFPNLRIFAPNHHKGRKAMLPMRTITIDVAMLRTWPSLVGRCYSHRMGRGQIPGVSKNRAQNIFDLRQGKVIQNHWKCRP